MNQLTTDFRDFVLAQEIPGCTITLVDDEHITLTTEKAVGQVNFYSFEDMPEVIELSIVDIDSPDDPKFFLHFELVDLDHAKELFDEMAQVLQEQDLFGTTRVLLCCTSGLTTAMFANRLTEIAQAINLDYVFDAMPLAQAERSGNDYDAILLAPQVGYQRAAVSETFPDVPVVEIPAKVFASYNAGEALKLVLHVLSDSTVFSTTDETDLRVVRDLKNDATILVVSAVALERSSWIGWRIYQRGEVVSHGSVNKSVHHPSDVVDLISTLHLKGWNPSELDAIGIAVPGVVNEGTIADAGRRIFDYDLGETLEKRYGTKVFVDNNANAAAVGCYVSQDTYDTLVLYAQQTGNLYPGQGIVVDGRLLKGRKNFAGETGPLFTAIHGTDGVKRLYDQTWTQEGMRSIISPILAADTSLIAPDAIFVAVDLLDDMDALHDEVAEYFTDKQDRSSSYIPDLIRVTDYRERIALGEFALCLQKLRDHHPTHA